MYSRIHLIRIQEMNIIIELSFQVGEKHLSIVNLYFLKFQLTRFRLSEFDRRQQTFVQYLTWRWPQ